MNKFAAETFETQECITLSYLSFIYTISEIISIKNFSSFIFYTMKPVDLLYYLLFYETDLIRKSISGVCNCCNGPMWTKIKSLGQVLL
jgi:hypothetical protein